MDKDKEIQFAEPQSVGMDPDRLNRASAAIEEGRSQGLYPGAVYLVGRRGKVVLQGACGTLDPEGTRPVTMDSIFDMASVTKPVATATTLLSLIEEGKLYLGLPIGHFFPNRRLPHLSEVTLLHLLTHTSGLPAWRDMYSKGQNREQIIEELFSTPLEAAPGKRYAYSCLGYIMLGLAIEAAAGESLDRLAQSRIFEPLGMTSTCFNPPAEWQMRIAATANCPARKRTMYGEVHDGNAWGMGGASGNAGLFSCAYDLARYCQMLLDRGMCGARRLFSPLTVQLAFRNLIDPSIGGHTAGWCIWPNEMLPAGDLLSRATIGHTGFTGTSVVIDPEHALYIVLLTNRVCYDDEGLSFRRLRRVFHNLVAQGVVE